MRKNAQPWDAVFDRVRGVYFAGRHHPTITTAADLNAVESELAFRFPLSYRAFAERFGVGGRVRGRVELLLLAPTPPNKPPGFRESVLEGTRDVRARATDPNYNRMRPRADTAGLVRFAVVDSVTEFAFYTGEITHAQGQEYRIYAWTRHEGWRPSVGSFTEWLTRVHGAFPYPDEEHTPEGVAEFRNCPLVYKPNLRGPGAIDYWANSEGFKTAPSAGEIKPWLAFNSNAVRDLARSIRGGHPEAFPVLADALEEAGCANADLLDSCRRGDPDIDGAWVLRVLLGE